MRTIERPAIVVGSTWEPLTIKLVKDGEPIPLDGATVALKLVNVKTGRVHLAAGAGVGAADGTATYELTDADVNAASVGTYYEQWTITSEGGTKVWRGPGKGIRIKLTIEPAL